MSRERESQSPRKAARDVKIEAETVVIHGDVAGRDILKEMLAARPPEAMPKKAVRALVVIASPVLDPLTGEEPPRLDTPREWRNIVEGVRGKPVAARLELLQPPTEKALEDALAEGAKTVPYAIVHFVGHGHRGLLAFDDGYGRVDPVKAKTLGETFRWRGVQLVVLNACRSAEAGPDAVSTAQALVDVGVPAVIAMQGPICDEAAILLAEVLYKRLADGAVVGEALEEAKKALRHQLSGLDADVPVLLGNEYLALKPGDIRAGVFPNNPPNNLPHNPYFFGRAEELVHIAEALDDTSTRAVALAGIGGIGKSALAVEAAWRNAWRFRAVVWAEAREGEPMRLEAVQDEARRLLGLGPADDLMSALEATPCLFILDNLHWLSEGEWRRICDFLRRLDPAFSKAILTYRVPWRGLEELAGVREFALPDLAPPHAVALLRAEARGKGVGWMRRASDENLQELARLCHHNPYFLQRVVGRATKQPLKVLLADLKALKGEFYEWAHKFLGGQVALLGDAGRKLFPRLSVFIGSADRDAVEAVCGDGLDVDEALLELVQVALVDFDPDEERYYLHDLAQAYARRELSEEEARSLARRHAQHYLNVARRLAFFMDTSRARQSLPELLGKELSDEELDALVTQGVRRASRLIPLERANMLAGQEHFLAQKKWEGAMAYGYALDELFMVSGLWADRLLALRRAVEAADKAGNTREMASLGHNLGVACQDMGDYAGARRLYQESLKAFEELGAKKEQAAVLHNLAAIAQDQGDYAEARRLYLESLKIEEELGDKGSIAKSLHQLGMLAQDTGYYAEARRLYQESLKAFEGLGAKKEQAAVLHQLGMLAQGQGDYAEARRLYLESLKIEEELGDKGGIAKSLGQLGILAQLMGDYAEARRLYQEAGASFQELGARKEQAAVLHQLGVLAQHTGDYAEARRLYQESLKTFEELGDKGSIASSLAQMALLEEQLGNLTKALALIRQAEALFQQLGSPMAEQARRDRERLEGSVNE